MDRHGQDIAAVIKDALCAIAVMHIDIQNRGSAPGFQKRLCGDGRVVEKAKSARQIAERVVPRGAAQRIGCALSFKDCVNAAKGRLRRPVGRFPCSRRDGTSGIGLMEPRLTHRRAWIACGAPVWVDVGDHFV